jgi:23S rRNA pseudouridine1911/1915/1917 synthase
VFQRHTAERTYLALAEGAVVATRIESVLAPDRGDGIRGSTRHTDQGQRAVTHIEPLRRLPDATLCRVRLETGRTHQIRIHLSERGHPIVGETVYIRDLLRAGKTPISSPRLMLHAASLGFAHPVTGVTLTWTAAPPADFAAVYESLGGKRGDF